MASPDSAAVRLAQLSEQGADAFDPPRFCYISALIRRSTEKRSPVRRRLEDKAQELLDDYQHQVEAAQAQVERQTARIAETDPNAAATIRGLLGQGDWADVKRHTRRFDPHCGRRALAELTDRLATTGRMAREKSATVHLDGLLQQQEQAVVASLTCPPDGEDRVPSPALNDLHALQRFQETWASLHADILATHALNHTPENPGHLNSQMLVTRCLARMRRLAPAYLRRWVIVMETLLWLETAGRDDASPSTKGRPKT